MKQLAMVVGLSVFTYLAWQIGSHLSSDALGMAVGLLFGMLAGGMPLLTDRQREIQAERSGRVFKVVGGEVEDGQL